MGAILISYLTPVIHAIGDCQDKEVAEGVPKSVSNLGSSPPPHPKKKAPV
jgi:hypothetical protein